jgi:hypothetical protein
MNNPSLHYLSFFRNVAGGLPPTPLPSHEKFFKSPRPPLLLCGMWGVWAWVAGAMLSDGGQ